MRLAPLASLGTADVAVESNAATNPAASRDLGFNSAPNAANTGRILCCSPVRRLTPQPLLPRIAGLYRSGPYCTPGRTSDFHTGPPLRRPGRLTSEQLDAGSWRESQYGDHWSAYPESAPDPFRENEGSSARRIPAEARRVHPCVHHNPEEAEFGSS